MIAWATVALALLGSGPSSTSAKATTAQAAATPDGRDSYFWSFLPRGSIRRCEKNAQEAKVAAEALRTLDLSIGELAADADPAAAVAQMRALLRLVCFHGAYEQGEPRRFTHALALKTWWADGGREWLESYLTRPSHGPSGALREQVVLPPEPRKVLTAETAPGHALLPLLCRAADVRCGSETRGWTERASSALETPDASHSSQPSFPVEPDAISLRCAEETRQPSAPASYPAWYTCVNQHFPMHWALPLGQFRAPTSGWLTIYGRRGHYEFCDEVRAYDLATGAAYVAASCSGLSLRSNGTVDCAKTDASRAVRVQVGRLNVDSLREAAWMTFLAPEAEQLRVRSLVVPLPGGMQPVLDGRGLTEGGITYDMWFNTSQTTLEWAWAGVKGRPPLKGTLSWPNSYRKAETHAAQLLDAAERGLIEGCPPAPLSETALPGCALPGVSSLDAEPKALSAIEAALVAALRAYRPPAECEPARPK